MFFVVNLTNLLAQQPTIEKVVSDTNLLFNKDITIEYSSDPMCIEYTKNVTLFLCKDTSQDYLSGKRPSYLFIVVHEYSHNLIRSNEGSNDYGDNESYYEEAFKLIRSSASYPDFKSRVSGAVAHANVDMLAARILFRLGLKNFIDEEFSIMSEQAKVIFEKLISNESDPQKK